MDLRKISQYDIFKNAVVGAVIGLCASFFIPFMRPVKGAFAGALILVAIGVYKNLCNNSTAISKTETDSGLSAKSSDELIRLDNLRKSGVITEEEFQAKKTQILNR